MADNTPALPSWAQTIQKLGKLQEAKSLWYNQNEIKLDGYRFVSCRFDKCRLVITSANFEIENCFIDAETVIIYGGEILKVIKLYNCRNNSAHLFSPTLSPIRNADGTFSIKN